MRYFKIFSADIHHTAGRYAAEKPRDAAKKAAAALFKTSYKIKTLNLSIKETTKNSQHKVYHYKCTYDTKIRIMSRKKTGGNDTFDTFPFEKNKFVLKSNNGEYLVIIVKGQSQEPQIVFSRDANHATIWKAEKSRTIALDRRPLYNIYSSDPNDDNDENTIDLGFELVKDDLGKDRPDVKDDSYISMLPSLRRRVNFYYNDKKFYPYTENLRTNKINQYIYNYFTVEFVS
jgi:hypothetical protein